VWRIGAVMLKGENRSHRRKTYPSIVHHKSHMDFPRILHGLIVQFRTGARDLYQLQSAQTDVGPTQPHVLWVPGALSPGRKWPEHEADHSLPSSTENKNSLSFTTNPPYAFIAWNFIKHRDKFTLNFHAYRHKFYSIRCIFNTVRGIQYLYLLNHKSYNKKPTFFGTKYRIVIMVITHNFFFCGARAQIGPRLPLLLRFLYHTQLDTHTR
jgi:hypothetical protein